MAWASCGWLQPIWGYESIVQHVACGTYGVQLAALVVHEERILDANTSFSGASLPGKDMDVFLQPVVEELKELWENGVRIRDRAEKEVFRLRAALLWTINDFPARSYLSGWYGQGYLACPTCNLDTPSLKVRNRIVYYDHRRFLKECSIEEKH